MTPQELVERFDISLHAATIRIQELARMNRRKLGIKRPLPPGVRAFLEDAKRAGHHITSLDDDTKVEK
jgi:hypothetical protein